VSNEQFKTFEDAYVVSISRPLMKLGRLAEARRDVQDLHASRPGDLTPVYFLSTCY
jgi:hypothetical protein